jgi:hypothetical protein
VQVADNTNCTARFERGTTPQRLTVQFNYGAPDRNILSDVPGINCFDGPGADCTEDYLPGTVVVLHSEYGSVLWENCDSVTESPQGRRYCVVRIDLLPRSVIAVFGPN